MEKINCYYAGPMGIDISPAKRIEKAWGEEHIICQEPHAAKIMVLKPGQQCSYHLHRNKTETFILIKGHLTIECKTKNGYEQIVELILPFTSVSITKMTPHIFYCPDDQTEETIFIEASTTDNPDDSYRFSQSGSRKENLCNR